MQRMREQCERLVPALNYARLDPEYPIAQGLRSVRKGDVRIKREPESKGSSQSRSFMLTVMVLEVGLWPLGLVRKSPIWWSRL